MSDNVKISLDTKALDALPKRVRGRASDAVQRTRHKLAVAIRAHAPVDAGELRDSVEEYDAGPSKGVVWVDAEHGIHVEYGTSRMQASPFIRPAVKAVKAGFEAEAKKVFE